MFTASSRSKATIPTRREFSGKTAASHQNLTFPVQPDYISGQHCWHQKVRITKPGPDDKYGDIFVDTNKSHEVYKKWLLKTRPAPGPDNYAGRCGCRGRTNRRRKRYLKDKG